MTARMLRFCAVPGPRFPIFHSLMRRSNPVRCHLPCKEGYETTTLPKGDVILLFPTLPGERVELLQNDVTQGSPSIMFLPLPSLHSSEIFSPALATCPTSRLPRAPVLLRAGVHTYDPGRELPDGLHQVGLGGHHPVDILVGGWRLVEGAAEQCDPLVSEVLLPGIPVELLESPRPAHAPAGPVGGAVHRVLDTEPQRKVARVGHGPRHDPEHAGPRGGGALAVHDHLLPAPLLSEREVVVVLADERRLGSDPASEAIVDHRVV